MTIDEMRKELIDYNCDEYADCSCCPHGSKEFCQYSEYDAPDEIIRKWHKEFFPRRYVTENDSVNHPSHYNQGKYECIDVMLETFGREAVRNFCLLNAFKYIWRTGEKNGDEDIEKAIWYLNKHLELGREEVSE